MDMDSICLGRLTLSLPSDRELLSGSGRVDDVSVEEIPQGAPQLLTALAASEAKRLQDDLASDTSLVTAEKTLSAAWIARHKTHPLNPDATAAMGVALVDGRALRLNALGDETVMDEVADAVERVATLLEPIAAPPPNGFCLPSGHMVAMEYGGYNEQAEAKFKLGNGDLLTIMTHTNNDEVAVPLHDELAERAREMREALGDAFDVEPLDQVQSTAFDGTGALVTSSEPGDILIWRARGEPRAPTAPHIEIRLETDQSAAERMAMMAAIVASLRPLGGV